MPIIRARGPLRALSLAVALMAAYTTPGHATVGRDAPSHTPPDTPPVVGVVRDTAGAPLANVQVIVVELDRVSSTNAEGEFNFRGLPEGTYHLTSILYGHAPGHADVTVPATGTAPVRVTIVMRPTPLTLSAVQVTATPIGTDPRNLAQSTVELSGQALLRATTSTVAQTLAGEPGVAVRYSGPAASAPVIRGLTGERILLLRDGQRAGDLSSTSADHAVSVDPLVAQRIEVVRGPASLLYGNNALGGVVNVISDDLPTQVPTHLEGYVTTQGESVTPGGAAAAGVTAPVGRHVALVARGGGRRVGDLRQGGGLTLANSSFRNYYGVGGLSVVGDDASGGVVYRGYRFEYGLPSAGEAGVRLEGQRDELSGRADITLTRGPLRSLRVTGTAQWYGHDEIEPSGEVGTRFDLKTQTVDVTGRTRLGRVIGAVGVSGLFRQYAAAGEEALTPAADSRGFGAFIYQELPLRAAADADALVPRLQFGGRYDLYRIASRAGEEKFGPGGVVDFGNVSGSVGLSVPLSSRVSVAVSAARAFRAPSVEELFSNANHEAVGTYDRGNPRLAAETNQGVDGVIRLRGALMTGQLAGYYNRIGNYIFPNIVKDTALVGEGGEVETVPLNEFSQGDATLRGLEGRLEAEVVRHLVLGAMGDVVRGELRGGTPLPFIPAARIGGLARWDNGRFSLGADVRHAFRQDRVPAAETERDPSAVATDDHTLVDLSLGLTFLGDDRVHSVLIRADNVLDERYRDAASRIKHFAFNPGRNLSVVYRVLF